MIEIIHGNSPIVLGLPHTGTVFPNGTGAGLNQTGRAIADTDWHIHEIYAGLLEGASAVRTTTHRYVIDVNRNPDGESLYPGQNTTTLCPLTDFDGTPIYHPDHAPSAKEIAHRIAAYHSPYHTALQTELDRVRAIHGFAILFDCHSIRSKIPFLFNDTLPDFNIGTNLGTTCDPEIEEITRAACQAATGYSMVLNGRFKGGWTTRHYGRPDKGVHAIQMELAQSTYLQTEMPPWDCDDGRVSRLRKPLGNILTQLSNWRPK